MNKNCVERHVISSEGVLNFTVARAAPPAGGLARE